VLPAERAQDGLLTDPPSDASVPETASSRQWEGPRVPLGQLVQPHSPCAAPWGAGGRGPRRTASHGHVAQAELRALHRCHGNTARIAVQVSRRTKMTRRAIEMLIAD